MQKKLRQRATLLINSDKKNPTQVMALKKTGAGVTYSVWYDSSMQQLPAPCTRTHQLHGCPPPIRTTPTEPRAHLHTVFILASYVKKTWLPPPIRPQPNLKHTCTQFSFWHHKKGIMMVTTVTSHSSPTEPRAHLHTVFILAS